MLIYRDWCMLESERELGLFIEQIGRENEHGVVYLLVVFDGGNFYVFLPRNTVTNGGSKTKGLIESIVRVTRNIFK